jgi:uncharacterized LabA/DUF88 family protein
MGLTLLGVGGRLKEITLAHRYAFIDGRYLEIAYNSLIYRFFGVDGELDYRAVASGLGAQRIYYYNAVDDEKRAAETDLQFEQRVAAEVARLSTINQLPGFHVRLGSVTGKAIKRRRQKQVDVQLAVDALLHAFNGNMSDVQLIAGDLDFKPLVEALVQLGVPTYVHYERTSATADFYQAADHAPEFDLYTAWSWSMPAFRARNPIPSASLNSSPPNRGTVQHTGRWNGRAIEKVFDSNSSIYTLFSPGTLTEQSLTMSFQDPIKLEDYFTIVHGPIEWQR